MWLALVSILWAYDGWGDLSFAAGEVKDPQRNLPQAIIVGTLAIIVIYLLTNVAYLYVSPIDTVARSLLVAADTMMTLLGRVGVALVSILAAIYRLRRQQPALPRPYRVIGYPVVPALFIVAVAAFVVNSLVNDTTNSVITFVVILAGIPVYAVAFARNRA